MKKPSDLQDKFMLRFPIQGLRAKIEEMAKRNGRSMNDEFMEAIKSHVERNMDIETFKGVTRQEFALMARLIAHQAKNSGDADLAKTASDFAELLEGKE